MWEVSGKVKKHFGIYIYIYFFRVNDADVSERGKC